MHQSENSLTRRGTIAFLGASSALLLSPAAMAASSADSKIALEQAIEALRVGMVEGDGKTLDALLHDRINYMHSSGHSQTKQNIMSEMAGKRFFASLTFSAQTVELAGDVGVVLQTIDQVKNLPNGKTRASQIKVLQTWVLTDGRWKLLTRSSHIISSPLVSPCTSGPAPTGS